MKWNCTPRGECERHTLLGEQFGSFLEVKHWSGQPTAKYSSKRKGGIHPHSDWYTNVAKSFICDKQKLETTRRCKSSRVEDPTVTDTSAVTGATCWWRLPDHGPLGKSCWVKRKIYALWFLSSKILKITNLFCDWGVRRAGRKRLQQGVRALLGWRMCSSPRRW